MPASHSVQLPDNDLGKAEDGTCVWVLAFQIEEASGSCLLPHGPALGITALW